MPEFIFSCTKDQNLMGSPPLAYSMDSDPMPPETSTLVNIRPQSRIKELPEETWHNIIGYLDPKDLFNLSKVNHWMRALVKTKYLARTTLSVYGLVDLTLAHEEGFAVAKGRLHHSRYAGKWIPPLLIRTCDESVASYNALPVDKHGEFWIKYHRATGRVEGRCTFPNGLCQLVAQETRDGRVRVDCVTHPEFWLQG